MAQYDGAIRIATKIITKDATESLASLEWQIKKSAKYMDELRSKMDTLKNQKIPTEEYQALDDYIKQLETSVKNLTESLKRLESEGLQDSNAYKNTSSTIEKMNAELEISKSRMQELVDTGKAFTLGKDTDQYKTMERQLQYEEEATSKAAKHYMQLLKTSNAYKTLGDVAKKAFNSSGNIIKKANSYVNSFGKRLKNIAQKILPTFHKETKRTNTVLGQFSTRLKSLLSGMFIFNAISAGFRKLFSGVGESFKNFYNYSSSFRKSVDSMRTSLLQLKNSFAAAFAPIVSVAIPYLEKLIAYITKAVNSIGQLIAALLGKKTYTRAIRTSVGGLEDTADAFEEVKESAKDAEKAIEGYLSPLDEINKYSEDKEVKIDIDTGKKPDASNIGDTIEDMFEEVPIDSYFLDLANKVKDIFSQLFAPLKEAWNREGKFVMDSWKYALGEVGDLIKSIGSDFLEVWQQEKTIKIFEDLLHIIGDIGLVVGNLAHNFRLAWEENETGKRILEGIRDIIGVIVANIRHAADVTVEWSKNLNFAPLLTKVQGWIESLVPVFDNLSGIITDFYEKFLLPLGKWTIEKGLPELLQVFIDFNNKVDWEALRSRLAQFWEHLEPFAETVGEGLIIFIERCANALADFIDSPAFDNFLTMIENWMDSVKPEDVADALEAIAKSIIALKVAVVGFSAISKGLTALSSLINLLKFFGAGGGATSAAGGFSLLSSAIGDLVAVAGGLAIFETLKNPIINLGEAAGLSSQQAEYMRDRYKGLGGDLKLIMDPLSILTNGLQGLGWEMSNATGKSGALDTAMNNIAKGMIYTDDKLSKMKKNFGLTNDDMEMLRQAMLDAHPELRNLADGFEGLNDASVETLSQINSGFEYMENGITNVDDVVFRLNHHYGELTPTAQDFFDRIKDGTDYFDYYKSSVENASESTKQFSDDITEAGENISTGITNGFEKADVETPVAGFFNRVKESLMSIFDMHSPAKNMEPFGENIFLGAVEGFKASFSAFTDAASEWWGNYVVPWFSTERWLELGENIRLAFIKKWNEIVEWWSNTAIVGWWEEHITPWFTAEKWLELFENIKTSLKEVWDNTVGQWGSDISAWWDNSVKPWFSKEKWEEILKGIPGVFSSKFSEVVETVKEKLQPLIDWVVEKVEWLMEKIGNVKEKFESIKSRTSSFFSGGLFGSSSFSTSTYSISSPAMASLSSMEIPKLATGAVIPANREFLAVLGDQKHGTNIEAPLDTIMQANEQLLTKAMMQLGMMGNTGSSNPQTIIIKQYLDRKQVAEAVVTEGKVRQMSTGSNMFMLGTT